MLQRLCCISLLAAILSPATFGQSLGGIVGEVKDGTGAVIAGATVAVFTVSSAAPLVTPPFALLTTTSKVLPLSDVVVAGVA